MALALLDHDDQRRMALALPLGRPAHQPAAHPRYRLPTVPGMGQMGSLGLQYAIPARARLPRVQDVAAYWRLVQWAQDSAGTRDGTASTKIGQASLTWAFAAAAVLVVRHPPPGQPCLARPGQAGPWPGRAHT